MNESPETDVETKEPVTEEVAEAPAAAETIALEATDLLPVEPAPAAETQPVAESGELAVASSEQAPEPSEVPAAAVEAEHVPSTQADETPDAETATTIAAESTPDASTEAEPPGTQAPEGESPAPPQRFDPGAAEVLIAEVAAAPHKVYHLGKVRKSAAAAGESEIGARLTALEAEIVAEIESRKSAKESLCEKAEALKDSTAWKVTGEAYKALFEEWRTIGAAGRQLDDELWARFNAARGAFNERRAAHFAEREQIWGENKEKKEALCAEAEALADSTDWKATAEKVRDLQAKWKEVGSAGRERDEALWARFNGAKQRFFDNRSAVWEENRKQKEALVLEAEALKDSDDWRTVGDAMKAMQTAWKSVGPAGREHEDELWRRFRTATQAFFDRRGSAFAERNQAERDNLSSKLELCERAEALVYTGDSLAAAREAKELQARWKETGPVPRDQSETLWHRFRQACDKIFENAAGERDRQQNEWHTRMREALSRKREQLVALRESITHDEANMERWRDSLSNLKPGGKSEEIGKSLEDKIIDVMNRIREKQGRVEDLRSSITDIEAKLRE